jgi:hypothetical protein
MMALVRKGHAWTKPPSPASLEHLQQVKEARKKEHLHSKGTDAAYKGHVKQGKEFLTSLVASMRELRVDVMNSDRHQMLDIAELEVAFGDSPNRHSPIALELFLTQKCLTENLGKDTANGIHAAFICHWDQMYVCSASCQRLQV